jgi:hypothetical protein
MHRPPSHRDAALLLPRVQDGADTATIALALASTWRTIDAALAPIIGTLGVAALYKRSVYLTSSAHPALSTLHEHIEDGIAVADPSTLTAALERQDLAQAAAAGDALLQTFCYLLTTLVGSTLADRLLDRVWCLPPSGLTAQDPSE